MKSESPDMERIQKARVMLSNLNHARQTPLHVSPELLASARRLARAESRCCERVAQAAELAEKWTKNR